MRAAETVVYSIEFDWGLEVSSVEFMKFAEETLCIADKSTLT
jgi:hypothetical protein